jgi:hypothetical protein
MSNASREKLKKKIADSIQKSETTCYTRFDGGVRFHGHVNADKMWFSVSEIPSHLRADLVKSLMCEIEDTILTDEMMVVKEKWTFVRSLLVKEGLLPGLRY